MDDPQLAAFADIFLEVNQRLNLCGAKDIDTLYARHIYDSLSLLDVSPIRQAEHILDLGSGGGLPGLLLALKRPNATITCLDATGKKVQAIQEMAKALRLNNVVGLHGRAEDLGRDPAHRQKYDVVVARAVAPLPTLLEYCAPFTRIHGFMVFMKGPDVKEEIKLARPAQRRLRVSDPRVENYELAGRQFTRIIYPMKEYVPKAYPRRNGLPRSKPLTR